MRRGVVEVISFDPDDADVVALRATIGKLRKRVAILTAVARLLVTLVRVSGLSLPGTRIATARSKNAEVVPRTLVNADATAQAILDELEALSGRMQQDDVAIFFFSGHGDVLAEEFLFQPYDVERESATRR